MQFGHGTWDLRSLKYARKGTSSWPRTGQKNLRKRKMRNAITTIQAVILIVVVVAVTALGTYAYMASQPKAPEIRTVRFLSTEFVDPFARNFMTAAVAQFNDEHPGVKVRLENVAWEDVITILQSGIEAGNPPDLIFTDLYSGILYARDQLLPVNDILDKLGRDEFYPGLLVTDSKGDDYLVPIQNEPMALYFRKDWFDELGIAYPMKTWNDLLQAAKKLTQDLNGDGTIDRWGIALPLSKEYKTAEDIWTLLQQSGQVLSDDSKTVMIDSPGVREAFKFWKELAQYCDPAAINWAWGDVRNAFKIEKAAMHFYQGRTLVEIWKNYPQLLDKIGIQIVPALKAEDYPDKVRPYTFSEGYMIVKQSKVTDISKEFILWFCSNRDMWREYMLQGVPYHELPTTKWLTNDPKFLDHPLYKLRPDLIQALLQTSAQSLHGDRELANPSVVKPIIGEIMARPIISVALQNYIFTDATLDSVMSSLVSDIDKVLVEAKLK